ncbi:hypothetical protein GCM10028818_07520 [Spirosoma horti]
MTTQDDEYTNNKPDAKNSPTPGDPREADMAEESESYVGSHAGNYDPENTADPDGPRDKPSGENTKNNGVNGGGLWTSGGQITTGTGMNDPGQPRPQGGDPD